MSVPKQKKQKTNQRVFQPRVVESSDFRLSDSTMNIDENGQLVLEEKVEPAARILDVSILCDCDRNTLQFVTEPPDGLSEGVIRSCFEPNIPSFKWERKEFLSVIEDVCRSSKLNNLKASLWGNSYASHYTIGGSKYKPHAVLDRLNNIQALEFRTDGPDLLFTIMSKNVDIDPRLISVLKVFHQMQNGGKRECLTSFVIQTKTTSMQYRGDNSVSKASNINRRIDKDNFEKIHSQLRLLVEENNVVEQEPEEEESLRDEVYENIPNNGFINYTLFVNNSTQGNNTTHISKDCLDARIEMRMLECKRGDSNEIWVAQSVYIRCTAGVNPYNMFVDTMNQMPNQVETHVKEVLNDMLRLFNRCNILDGNDAIRSQLPWLTIPCALSMMISSWCIQEGVEIVSSDIPLANKEFINVILGCVYQNIMHYIETVDSMMNQCKPSSKAKQNKLIADTVEIFRGAYIHPELDEIIYSGLPPASMSFLVDLSANWKTNVGVFELTNKCVFANIFNVICNPKLKPSDLFLEEIKNMRRSKSFLDSMNSIEGKWVSYMLGNSIEQRDSVTSEIESVYLKTTGKHDPSNKNYAVLMGLAMRTGSISSMHSTMNLIMHQVDDFAFYSASNVIKSTVDITKILSNNQQVQQSVNEYINDQLLCMMRKKNYNFRCMHSASLSFIQDYLSSLNSVFQLNNTNLNLLWVMIMSTLSYSLPLEPAWATCIMVVDAACQSELVHDKKGGHSMTVGGSKCDSTGFNFVQASFTQFMAALSKVVGTNPPELVVSQSSYSDGKRKRMGLTLAVMNNKDVNEENTTHISDYGRVVCMPEDCHKMLADTGTAKNFLREACEKKETGAQSCKITENYNMKLILVEEPRILCMATNKTEMNSGDTFSMSARIRFHASGMSDDCTPLRFSYGSSVQSPRVMTKRLRIKETNDVNFAMKNNLCNLLSNSGVKNNNAVELNVNRSSKNIIPLIVFHLASHVEQVITLSGFKLNCNTGQGVSKLILKEMNYFMFRLMEPFFSIDMNNEDRFTRKQLGLMFSYTVPLHVINMVNRKVMAEIFKTVSDEDDEIIYSFDFSGIIRETVVQLLHSDIDTSLICSGYVSNINFDTVMYVLFRCVMRVLEFPYQYSLSSLVRLVKFGESAVSREELKALRKLKVWIENRMKFFVTLKDLINIKPKPETREMCDVLGIDSHYSMDAHGDRMNRSIFLTDPMLLAQNTGDEEQAEKNMWKVLYHFLMQLPEIQHALGSFRLRKELLSPELFHQLFNSRKMNRKCLNDVFMDNDIHISEILMKLGVDPRIIPSSWQNLSLQNLNNDEANKNSNVFNMVVVGQNCCLSVNFFALILNGPIFKNDNINFMHQLQQKNTITEMVKTTLEMRVPRIYWPKSKVPTIQVDHMGEWASFNMSNSNNYPHLSQKYFKRMNDIIWNGSIPAMGAKKSKMNPFFLEEIYVCGDYIDLCKKMIDGIEHTDNSFHCKEYFNFVRINDNEFPFQFPNLPYNGRYIMIRWKLWSILDVFDDSFNIYIFQYDEDADTMDFKVSKGGNFHDLNRLLYMMKMVPFPIINHTRLVFFHDKFVDHYYDFNQIEGFRFADFAVLVQHEDQSWCNTDGFYLVEVTAFDSEGEKTQCQYKIRMDHLHHVLVPELHTIYVKYDYFQEELGKTNPPCSKVTVPQISSSPPSLRPMRAGISMPRCITLPMRRLRFSSALATSATESSTRR